MGEVTWFFVGAIIGAITVKVGYYIVDESLKYHRKGLE